jgi:hypothetical protein
MPDIRFGVDVSGGGISIQRTVVRTVDHPNPYQVVLPLAHVATAWVKTDADTAACNVPTGHGIVSTDLVDVYWTGGQRIGVVATVSTDALALEGGTGTDFPATANATVTIAHETLINTTIDGDVAAIVAISLEYADPASASVGYLKMEDSAHASIENFALVANAPRVTDITGGDTNIFTGNPITHSHASSSDAVYAATLKILAGEDSTP